MINIADRIKQLRQDRNLNQSQLAQRLRVSRPTVTQWENGSTKNIRLDNLMSLADVFDMSVEEFLKGSPERHPQGIRDEPPDYETPPLLSKHEKEVIALYRALSPERQDIARGLLRSLGVEIERLEDA